ncbi:MAG TPA: hypothetical protein V6D20_09980 [Candidatus Obscuribacterales bacterium]
MPSKRQPSRGMGFARPRQPRPEDKSSMGQSSPKAIAYRTAFMAIAAEPFATVIAFYQRFLDQAPNPLTPDRYGEFQLGPMRLGIFRPQPNHVSEFSAASSGPLSLCLEVPNLEAAIAQVQAAGGACLPDDIILTSHGREVYAYDPVGNRLILHEGFLS